MADLIVAGVSGYATGSIDTASTVVNNVTATDAVQPNGLAAAIIQLETILGVGTTLKGGLADLVTRLAVGIQADGLLKLSTDASLSGTLNVSKGGTGLVTANQGKRYLGKTTTLMQAVDVFRREVFTSSGTFTCPADVVQVFVEVYGAGGGGRGGAGGQAGDGGSVSGNAGSNGGRGSFGGYASGLVAVTPAGTTTVTIGVGGSGGGGGAGGDAGAGAGTGGQAGGDGGTGTATSFGTSVVAGAGVGGTSSYDRIADGVGTAGSVLRHGGGNPGGIGGAGGAGGAPASSGSAGTAGSVGFNGLVIVWY